MIWESGIVTASDADLLATGRLNALPYNGTLTLRFLSDLAVAANNFSLTIQKPDGDVPVDAQLVPAEGNGTVGVIDERQLIQFSFNATQGGHFTVSLTMTGTAVCTYQAVLSP